MTQMLPEHLSEAQQAFVRAAEAMGASAPTVAQPLTELPRLSARELADLVERELVREAADWRYYVFRTRHARPTAIAPRPLAAAPWTRGRALRALLFWIIVILIPVFFLQLTRRG